MRTSAPNEEGCFCLLRDGKGANGRRLLVTEAILPPEDAWEAQGRDQLRPSGRWISAVISRAVEEDAGLLFLHSHPDPCHPAGFSPADQEASRALAATIAPILGGPFAVGIVHPTGWIAALVHDGCLEPIDRVAAVGRILRSLDPPPTKGGTYESDGADLDSRQRDALGAVHDRLRSLDVGIVGVGGLGSPIAEQLVRMGVLSITLIDDDLLDTASNVRRVFGSTGADLRATAPAPKVDVVGRHLEELLLDVSIRRVKGDVRTEGIYRALLDTDIVICGTDTHGSRAAVNDLASTYLLPVIDICVRVGAKAGGYLTALPAEVRVLTPHTPCLWCRGAISANAIRIENLPPEQRGRLRAEGYLQGWTGEPAASVVALTVLGAGLAACALLALLSEEGEASPSGYIVDGFLAYAMETRPVEPKPECRCRSNLGMGDNRTPPLLT